MHIYLMIKTTVLTDPSTLQPHSMKVTHGLPKGGGGHVPPPPGAPIQNLEKNRSPFEAAGYKMFKY